VFFCPVPSLKKGSGRTLVKNRKKDTHLGVFRRRVILLDPANRIGGKESLGLHKGVGESPQIYLQDDPVTRMPEPLLA